MGLFPHESPRVGCSNRQQNEQAAHLYSEVMSVFAQRSSPFDPMLIYPVPAEKNK